MDLVLSGTRANQRNARGLFATFNGAIILALGVVNTERQTFQANVTFETGNVGTPTVTFTPCDDLGRVRTFGDVDDLLKWVNGAFNDVTSIEMEVVNAEKLAKPFVPPTDTLANATRQKTVFTALKQKADANKAIVDAKVAAEVAAGNDQPEAHPALQAIYNEYVAQQDSSSSAAGLLCWPYRLLPRHHRRSSGIICNWGDGLVCVTCASPFFLGG